MNELMLVKATELYEFLTNKLAVHGLDNSELMLRNQITRALEAHYKFMEICLLKEMRNDPKSTEEQSAY